MSKYAVFPYLVPPTAQFQGHETNHETSSDMQIMFLVVDISGGKTHLNIVCMTS